MKTFTVIGQTVKFGTNGVINMYDYLNNTEHKNHKGKTEKILQVFHNDKFVENVVVEVEKKNLLNQINRKGGRPIKEFAQSFCFTLPNDISLTEQEWNIVSKIVFNDLSKYFSISPKELLKFSEINVHIQQNQHLNFLIGKVVAGNSLHLSNKKLMEMLKKSFTEAVLGLHPPLRILLIEKKKKTNERTTKMNVYQMKQIKQEKEQINEEKTHIEQIWEQINKVKEENHKSEQKAKKYIINIGKNLIKYMDTQTTEEERKQIKNWLSQQVGKLYNQKSKKELTKTIQNYISDFSPMEM